MRLHPFFYVQHQQLLYISSHSEHLYERIVDSGTGVNLSVLKFIGQNCHV